MFHDHERYQVFCRWCQRKYEADTVEEAVAECEEHEQSECKKKRPVVKVKQ